LDFQLVLAYLMELPVEEAFALFEVGFYLAVDIAWQYINQLTNV
jgi:hypothetical protein